METKMMMTSRENRLETLICMHLTSMVVCHLQCILVCISHPNTIRGIMAMLRIRRIICTHNHRMDITIMDIILSLVTLDRRDIKVTLPHKATHTTNACKCNTQTTTVSQI